MKGLRFFSRTNDRRLWNIASYHDPDSITWSWILSIKFESRHRGRAWYFFHSHRGNQGLHWHLLICGVSFQWQTQNKMPYTLPSRHQGGE